MTTVESPNRQEAWVNPSMLQWARERVGLSPAQVEAETKERLSAQQIIAWENRQGEPSIAQLEELAHLYRCPLACFFWSHIPPTEQDRLKPRWDFRGLRPGKAGKLDYETWLGLLKFKELAEYAGSVDREMGVQRKIQIEEIRSGEDLEAVGTRERNKLELQLTERDKWNTVRELLAAVRRRIEDLGIFVFALKLNPKQVRGASLWEVDSSPAILVNRADVEAATGRLFTLVHEYVHLLIKKPTVICDFSGRDNDGALEHRVNKLATEILVPSAEGQATIKSMLYELSLPSQRTWWGDPTLDKLRKPLKVSRDVIAIFLEEHGMAPAGFYRNKRIQWEKKEWRPGKGPPLTIPGRKFMEVGANFSFLLLEGNRQGRISILDVAHLLDIRIEQAERFLQWSSLHKATGH